MTNARAKLPQLLIGAFTSACALSFVACGGDEDESGDSAGTETGDGDGDATTGPTTGDGDGDGDPTTGDGDGDGDPTTGDGDPECDAFGDAFMSYCNVPTPMCPSSFFCFLHQAEAGNVNDFIGYCSPECETDADCTWGSDAQCSDMNFQCVTPDGASQARCVLPCEGDEDCYPGQVCHGAYDLCVPVEP